MNADALIETTNDHLVGRWGKRVQIGLPPIAPMLTDEALRMAAWIVVIADEDDRFASILAAVRST